MKCLMLLVINEFAKLRDKKICNKGKGYRYYHSMEVAKIALYINKMENLKLNQDILIVISLAHDIKKDKEKHGKVAWKKLSEIIEKNNIILEEIEIEYIQQAISEHSKAINSEYNLYTKVLQDADKLSKVKECIPPEIYVDRLDKYKTSKKKILEKSFNFEISKKLCNLYKDN